MQALRQIFELSENQKICFLIVCGVGVIAYTVEQIIVLFISHVECWCKKICKDSMQQKPDGMF